MKLLSITTRYYLLFVFIIMSIASGIFYMAMKHEVYVNSDEALLNRKNRIVRIFENKKGQIGMDVSEYSDFILNEISNKEYAVLQDLYRDTLIYEPTDQEFDDYRQLQTKFLYNNKYYKLTILKPELEDEEIITALAIGLISLFLLVSIALTMAGRRLSSKLWEPFYRIIDQLSNFQLEKQQEFRLTPTKIHEFNTLNESLFTMTEKSREVYQSQKRFIENASHEIQTPLAIIKSKLELLLQQPELTPAIATLVQTINDAADRLSKLNKTLLLLVKIENKQFDEEEVDLSVLIKSVLERIEGLYQHKKIKVSEEISSDIKVQGNMMLFEILFSNLIKNAFVHNQSNGEIHINLSKGIFLIENSGPAPQFTVDRIFDRFVKDPAKPNHLGLGLALVKQICDTYNWNLHYQYENKMHQFAINLKI